jgi:hypothetical protein
LLFDGGKAGRGAAVYDEAGLLIMAVTRDAGVPGMPAGW